jgi:hypothetical protein
MDIHRLPVQTGLDEIQELPQEGICPLTALLDHLQAFLERSGEFLLCQTRLRTGLDYRQGIPKVMGQAGDHGLAHHFDPGSPFRLIPQLLNCPDCLVKILQ